jgi:hypothetical protein
MLGESTEKTFTIQNVSSFPVSFKLEKLVDGVTNKSKQLPFTLMPAEKTIPANDTTTVKIVFTPDQINDHFFEVLLIDIPNQINAKRVYLRGQCYNRQMGIREFTPFEWRPLDELKKRYEEPLALLDHNSAQKEGTRRRIVLEYLRDEDALKVQDYPHLQEQNRVRKILVGNCKLEDVKMEKNGNYEFNAGVSINL